MTNTLRTFIALCALGTGCTLDSSLKYSCTTQSDCNDGNTCDNGVCVGSAGSSETVPPASAADSVLVPTTMPPPECSAPTSSYYTNWLTEANLVGTWLGCGSTDLFADPDQVGVEFAADGSFYVLDRQASGSPVRSPDPTRHGSFDLTYMDGDADGAFTLHLPSSDVHGTLGAEAVPTRIHLAFGGNVGTFVSAPLERPAACDAPVGNDKLPWPKDTSTMWAEMQGRWAFCNGFADIGTQGGVEFERGSGASGTYYLLVDNGSGELVRATGLDSSNDVTVDLNDGSGVVQFDTAVGGTAFSFDLFPGSSTLIMHDELFPRFVRIE